MAQPYRDRHRLEPGDAHRARNREGGDQVTRVIADSRNIVDAHADLILVTPEG
jgi:hypothetical protein